MCRGHSFNGTWTDTASPGCRSAFTEAYTYASDLALARVGLQHKRLGLMRVRTAPGSALERHRVRRTRCLPSFLVIGTQKGGTSTLHYVLTHGWHPAIAINGGEKEIHYFSLDDNFARGASFYQQHWDGPDATLGECPDATVRGEVSASYFDYPKVAERAAAMLPLARIVLLLREPVARIQSSFNMRWQIEVCGKLTWTRPDCYAGLSSRDMVRDNAVGPMQRGQALHIWTKCAGADSRLDVNCLRDDFQAKLRNRTRTEMRALDACPKDESLGTCLGFNIPESQTTPKKVYRKMENAAYVYRSVYHEHLQNWLRHYEPAQLLVLASEALFDPAVAKQAMVRLKQFLHLDGATDESVLSAASPASTTGGAHENGREYVARATPDVVAALTRWLCPKNLLLGELLSRHHFGAMPWVPASCGAASASVGEKRTEGVDVTLDLQ